MTKRFLIILVALLWCNVGVAECIEGNCINGQGTYNWNNGNSYVGEFKDHERHGQGTYTLADGTILSGTWENGEPGKDIRKRHKSFNFSVLAKPRWPSKVDYQCLNMCKTTVKGMTIGELNSFCMMRCSLN